WWRHWGEQHKYFDSRKDAEAFHDELAHMLLNQVAAPNSPQWFNTGLNLAYGITGPAQGHWVPDPETGEARPAPDAYTHPQPHACYIQAIKDDLVGEGGIMDLWTREARLFKYGSGTGTNFSSLRGENEPLSGGGKSSGLMSFLRIGDRAAGAIKSGGTTRRAAKMVCLDADHPDIEAFVNWKTREELKVAAMVEGLKNLPAEQQALAEKLGLKLDYDFNGEAYQTVSGQNSNNSVRLPASFFEAIDADGDWQLIRRTDGQISKTIKARDLWEQICFAAWRCADPGLQFDTTINDWHTCPNTGPITASNPCSEYMHIDDSACNLASINLLKFLGEDGSFDVEAYRRVIALSMMAQEIIVGNSSYPTEKIGENAIAFRQLGLGYANLGALLMCLGVPYDSDEGRAWAASLTAVMTGEAYATSARVAARMGPFAGYEINREPMIGVMEKHQAAVEEIDAEKAPANLVDAAKECWADAVQTGREHGYRNAQATVLAPTGTISFMMDCDTTGIEPDIALVKYKTLVGGGMMKIVNGSVERALGNLGYSEADSAAIIAYIDEHGTVEGAPGLADEHQAVFDCAFKSPDGTRTIHWLGHVKMMGAVQPFISGAISKTVNLPEEATVEEIEEAYIEGWKHGVKALAIYRDGSKRTQVLSTSKDGAKSTEAPGEPVRRRLPATRTSVTHKFSIEGHEGYITAGLYEHGAPGEIWLTMAKEGSTLSGMMDAFATSISLALQYGVPLRDLVNKFSHMRFEPSGRTENNEIPVAQSIVDYIFRWLASSFLSEEEKEEFGVLSPAVKAKLAAQEFDLPSSAGNGHTVVGTQTDAPPCMNCGWIMTRAGTCYKCDNCGTTTGCG
ncbi:MAG: vitamin B12-dependent ribonucleotide reductase, partial [Chloroflexi bacterium]|nr:vitamin B12-dependent ribonucleotide reductase [Chloroflexota bacterium]